MIVPAGPFPVMCVAYYCIGFTLAVQAAQSTGYVASLKRNSREKMGFLHGTYGSFPLDYRPQVRCAQPCVTCRTWRAHLAAGGNTVLA